MIAFSFWRHDFRISRAAAKIARQVVPYLVVGRVGIFIQQLARHQHEPRRAEAALEGARLDERFLDGVEFLALLHSLHVRALGERREVQAAGHRGAIHEHGAAAAKPLSAAFARAIEAELLAQHLDQRLVWRDLRFDRFAIQAKLHGTPHRFIAM